MVGVGELSSALKGALERGEISAWFQPQIDLRTERVVSAEALCRWHHPVWGWVGPNEFIPIAEEDGTIDDIGRYMAVQALEAMAEWDIDVSVNVSPAQLENAVFTAWLERLIRRVRPTRRLTVEVTEGRHLDHVSALVKRLDRLRALRVGIAIDDFGAGQASLTQVRRLHATELKIDRSLVKDDSPATAASLAAVIDEAHLAGIRVVAEGIETRTQLRRVIDLGCDLAQGYLLGRPMPKPEMTRRLQAS